MQFSWFRRGAAIGLSVLIGLPAFVPVLSAISSAHSVSIRPSVDSAGPAGFAGMDRLPSAGSPAFYPAAESDSGFLPPILQYTVNRESVPAPFVSLDADRPAVPGAAGSDSVTTPPGGTPGETPGETPGGTFGKPSGESGEPPRDPSAGETESESAGDTAPPPAVIDPHTQEGIAAGWDRYIQSSAAAGQTLKKPFPDKAIAVSLTIDGNPSPVLNGQIFSLGGTVYVPVQRFADRFGDFRYSENSRKNSLTIRGPQLEITVTAGQHYITVNERIFYTGQAVLSLDGWLFAPLSSMAKAMNASVKRSADSRVHLQSGNPAATPWAADFYDETDLYWLSRIISAEARGEPFRGQIAVGNVVMNRVRSREFPRTVKGVIFDRKYGVQFSPVALGTIYQTPTASAVLAAKICLEGYSLSTRALYFYNPALATSDWIGRTRPYIMTIGSHKFYG